MTALERGFPEYGTATTQSEKEGNVVSAPLSTHDSAGGSALKGQAVVASLAEAHEMLRSQRPEQGADLREWVAFHRHSAKVYVETAKIDRRHRHEAVHRAGLEIRKARGIEDSLDPALGIEEAHV